MSGEKKEFVVFNFSHPLSDAVKQEIAEAKGCEEVREIRVDAQFDLESELWSQVVALWDEAELSEDKTIGADAYVPPAFAPAAALMARLVVLWVRREGRMLVRLREGQDVLWVRRDGMDWVLGGIE
jgi:hypothetical protein